MNPANQLKGIQSGDTLFTAKQKIKSTLNHRDRKVISELLVGVHPCPTEAIGLPKKPS